VSLLFTLNCPNFKQCSTFQVATVNQSVQAIRTMVDMTAQTVLATDEVRIIIVESFFLLISLQLIF
jgi:hypothetical protein